MFVRLLLHTISGYTSETVVFGLIYRVGIIACFLAEILS